MDHNPSQSPVRFNWSPNLGGSMPTPIDYNASGVDIPQDLHWAQYGSSPYHAHDHGAHEQGQHGAASNSMDNVTPLNREGDDITMEDRMDPPASVHLAPLPTIPSTSRRSKYADLDWDGHRAKLYELYIQDGKTLLQTMKIMRDEFGFDAPAKAFKDKFKYWGFQKNLSRETAQWMVQRALLRQERSKETQFEYGGQKWTLEQALNRANRSKKPIEELANTPEGMVVSTPENPNGADSPDDRGDVEEQPRSPSVAVIGSIALPTARGLPLSYNGKTRQDLAEFLGVARASAQQGDAIKAEQTYIDVFHGLEHLLSPTAVETVKIGYEIASFYWEHGRKADADGMLETMSATHIRELGMDHRSTQQHILHIVEMLNSWKRGEDALVLLQHARDIEENERRTRPRKRNKAQETATSSLSVDERLQSLYTEVDSAVNPTPIDEGLANARIFMATNHPTIEVLLKAIERQCLNGPSGMVVQGLRARAELLKHYISKGGHLSAADRHSFETAADRLKMFWQRTRWDKKQFQSHEVIEASLELAAGVLRGKLVQHARWIFGEIEKKATDVFGADDERTIWALINIGIIYQTYRSWGEAKRWFETALAASLAAWNRNDGVTRSLENAMDNCHFRYINDEGRPFETIFGVCGVTIRPTRLHLE